VGAFSPETLTRQALGSAVSVCRLVHESRVSEHLERAAAKALFDVGATPRKWSGSAQTCLTIAGRRAATKREPPNGNVTPARKVFRSSSRINSSA
jgi:hypothetical protein